MPNTGNPDSYLLLGEIRATVTNTSDDVKAIRLDMSDMTRRINELEVRLEAVEAERAVMVPQYTNFKHDTNNELQRIRSWQSRQEGAFWGGSLVGKLAIGVAGALLGVGGIEGAQALQHSAVRSVTNAQPGTTQVG